MSDQADITALQTRFLDVWAFVVPVVLNGEPAIDEPNVMWARFEVAPVETRRRSIATRNYTHFGRINLQVFIPHGTGMEDGQLLCDKFEADFTDWRSDDFTIRCETADVKSSNEYTAGFTTLVRSIRYTSRH